MYFRMEMQIYTPLVFQQAEVMYSISPAMPISSAAPDVIWRRLLMTLGSADKAQSGASRIITSACWVIVQAFGIPFIPSSGLIHFKPSYVQQI